MSHRGSVPTLSNAREGFVAMGAHKTQLEHFLFTHVQLFYKCKYFENNLSYIVVAADFAVFLLPSRGQEAEE